MSALPFGMMRVGHSFWRRRSVPHVPTPTERMQAYRLRQPVVFANDSLPRREARNQPDPPDYRYFTEHSYDELSHGY